MCGIYASIGLPPDPDRIDRVAHRGPDGRGWDTFKSPAGPVCLGHRRLAIIDLSTAGVQPMADRSGRYHLVYNGEIYNYRELRAELTARGEIFATETDSEVLLRAFICWGRGALTKLRGMFAFVIYDRQTHTVFAARDRFGIKPVYLAATSRTVAFASEIKQLLGLPGVSGRLNRDLAFDYLTAGMQDHTSGTMYEGITQLRPGELATVVIGTAAVKVELAHWYRPSDHASSLAGSAAADDVRARLEDSVRLHLRSDVAIGSCLSGGLDSSAIVGLVRAELPDTELRTVSACYAGESVDERRYVDAVSSFNRTRATIVTPRAEDLFDQVRTITWHQDEPFGSTSIYAQWCVFAAAREAGVKVMLDGQGADETFAGYHTAFAYDLASHIRRGKWLKALAAVRDRSRVHGASVNDQLARAAMPLAPAWLRPRLRSLHRRRASGDWINPGFRAANRNRDPMEVAAQAAGVGLARNVDSLCVAMTFSSNLQMLLHWEDRNSMAHGIEARVPFLDHPLVELALSLAANEKIEGATTKNVLRRAVVDRLPALVRDRQDKIGFATPEASWMKGPLRPLIADGVASTLRNYPDLFDRSALQRRLDQTLSGAQPADSSLWRVVNFGLWGEIFKVGV